MTRPAVRWYFDFVSPYAYLQSLRLPQIEEAADVERVPVLFAGLLSHWGTTGPAEVAPKRTFTLQHICWIAHTNDVRITLPTTFPFNPLSLLRLAIVKSSEPAVVTRIYDWVWREGHTPDDIPAFDALLAELDVDRSMLDDAGVKFSLRANTETAIAAGVFGVPSTIVGDDLFWGQDSTEMLLGRLRGDPFFDSAPYKFAPQVAFGAKRRK
ncbi:MAG: 2-hydroxychromene-2-carboxylate isomerase [Gemmatimonadota bacterium]